MPRVRNKRSGREFEVPTGHFSLVSADYTVVPEPQPEPEPVKPEKPKRKPKE